MMQGKNENTIATAFKIFEQWHIYFHREIQVRHYVKYLQIEM